MIRLHRRLMLTNDGETLSSYTVTMPVGKVWRDPRSGLWSAASFPTRHKWDGLPTRERAVEMVVEDW